ncbi:hypothetical protein Cgig2_028495 [Carnegiea gigantea]|uniref:Uncharacterized protein n=1 Tax=Carnegiea gigantea TaxID=171969 RepID=A0A9Q1Q7G1_9CARY|nr:hypothetical protein Cgig2_028495 [Carnegiea gigantea]
MTFIDKKQLRDAFEDFRMMKGYDLKIRHNDTSRFQAFVLQKDAGGPYGHQNHKGTLQPPTSSSSNANAISRTTATITNVSTPTGVVVDASGFAFGPNAATILSTANVVAASTFVVDSTAYSMSSAAAGPSSSTASGHSNHGVAVFVNQFISKQYVKRTFVVREEAQSMNRIKMTPAHLTQQLSRTTGVEGSKTAEFVQVEILLPYYIKYHKQYPDNKLSCFAKKLYILKLQNAIMYS